MIVMDNLLTIIVICGLLICTLLYLLSIRWQITLEVANDGLALSDIVSIAGIALYRRQKKRDHWLPSNVSDASNNAEQVVDIGKWQDILSEINEQVNGGHWWFDVKYWQMVMSELQRHRRLLWEMISAFFVLGLQGMKIRLWQWQTTIGLEDQAQLGIICGGLWALKHCLLALLTKSLADKPRCVAIDVQLLATEKIRIESKLQLVFSWRILPLITGILVILGKIIVRGDWKTWRKILCKG